MLYNAHSQINRISSSVFNFVFVVRQPPDYRGFTFTLKTHHTR